MLLGTLGASMLGNLLSGKGIVRAGYWKRMGFLMPPYPLTNFEMQIFMRMNQNLMVSILETICLKKNKGWGIRNKA